MEERIDAENREDTDNCDGHTDTYAGKFGNIHCGSCRALAAGQELNVGDDRIQDRLNTEEPLVGEVVQALRPVIPIA